MYIITAMIKCRYVHLSIFLHHMTNQEYWI